MTKLRESLVVVVAAVCLMAVIGGLHAVVLQADGPGGGPCCGNIPSQCEAASVCYDHGYCLDAKNMCQTTTLCQWVACDR